MNWDDPAERARLIESVGAAEYNRRFAEHREASIIKTVNGHAIRPVNSMRFGRLYMVGDTGTAFSTVEDAEKFAGQKPPAS